MLQVTEKYFKKSKEIFFMSLNQNVHWDISIDVLYKILQKDIRFGFVME